MGNWNVRANAIFLEAVELKPADRGRFLDQACGSGTELRAEVDSLLEARQHLSGFLETSASSAAATEDSLPIAERPGADIGSYQLIEEIGEGGMGRVFMALQRGPVRRKVALKIIKPGMDTREVIARFEAEQQALAMMDHPNIATVHDAGSTESGRPYFVMELVEGVPITRTLRPSASLSSSETSLSPRDGFLLSMAYCRMGDVAEGKAWYLNAVKWMDQKTVYGTDVKLLRAEAATLLQVDGAQLSIDYADAISTASPEGGLRAHPANAGARCCD